MAIKLDHTIVPARDKLASAEFFADMFGLTVKPGYFVQVRINDELTLDFSEHAGPVQSNHYAFHVTDAEFDEVLNRVKDRGIRYGSGPRSHTDGQLNTRRGGRGFYFQDPNGHMLELMTVPETGR